MKKPETRVERIFEGLNSIFGVTDALSPQEPLPLLAFNNLEWRDAARRGK
jgi:hypothetical protein